MTLPDIDDLDSLGGALQDLSPVTDPSTDRSATGANPAYTDTAAMTATAIRAWVSLSINGTTPTLVAHNSVWGNSLAVQPTLAYTSSTGIFSITWPAIVADAIPNGLPGYNAAGHTLNLRDGWANAQSVTFWHTQILIHAANVAYLYLFNSSGSLANPGSATTFGVFVI